MSRGARSAPGGPFGIVALLLLAPTLALGALGPRYGGDLTLGVVELPPSTDPSVPRSLTDALVAGLVHETLLGIGPDGIPVPALAQTWASAAAGRELSLGLAEDARFHDDRPLTSEDAVRSLRRFLRSPSAAAASFAESLDGGMAFRSGAQQELPGLAAPDALHLTLRLVEPRPLPLAPLAARAAAVTGSRGAGSGPFVPTVHVPGSRLGLTAFGAHVRGRPYLDRIQVVAFPDRQALRAELQAGKVDLAPGEPGESALAATLLLVLDPSQPPFQRAEARAALAAALDRADLVRNLLPGGDAAATLLVPSLLPPLGLEALPARRSLSGRLSMTVATDVPPLVSQRIVAYLAVLGLQVEAIPCSPAAARTAAAPARLLLWSPEVPEPGLALRELSALSTPVRAAQDALEAAARERDPDRRRVELHRAEAALRAEGVLVPLASVPVSFGARHGLHGARVDMAGRLVLEDAWIEP